MVTQITLSSFDLKIAAPIIAKNLNNARLTVEAKNPTKGISQKEHGEARSRKYHLSHYRLPGRE